MYQSHSTVFLPDQWDEVVVPTSQLLLVVSISSSSSCIKWLLFQSRSSFITI
jgi:hypothetical protein